MLTWEKECEAMLALEILLILFRQQLGSHLSQEAVHLYS